jgi:hypothetical protein
VQRLISIDDWNSMKKTMLGATVSCL